MYDPEDLENIRKYDYKIECFQNVFNNLAVEDIISNLEPNDVRRRYRLEVLPKKDPQMLDQNNIQPNQMSFMVVPHDEFDSLIDSRHPYSHPLQSESKLPDYAFDHKGALRRHYNKVNSLVIALNKDTKTAHLLDLMRLTQKDPGDVYNWLLLVLFMAKQIPHPADPVVTSRKFSQPGELALRRSARMLIGDRGAVHGWSTCPPDFDMYLSRFGRLEIPYRWAPHENTDGDSEFDSDSSGHGANTDGSGPRGVKPNYPAVTGWTSDSETDDDEPVGQMDEHKLMKRFDRYLADHNRERRQRRSVRAARRWIREKYDKEERLKSPMFNLEAKRAEALAAEKVRREIKNVERINAEKQAVDRLERKQRHQNENTSDTKNYPTHGYHDFHTTDKVLANSRIQKFRAELCEQVKCTWSQYYGNRSKTNNPSQKDNDHQLECFMTPVRWIQQQGPK